MEVPWQFQYAVVYVPSSQRFFNLSRTHLQDGAKSSIDLLQEDAHQEWSNIWNARRRSADQLERIRSEVSKSAPPDTDLLVFGSLARLELTSGSDVDWALLVDGQAYASHATQVMSIGTALARIGIRSPASGGSFADFVSSHDLIHHIGGEDDSNSNTTRRMLLLLESKAVSNGDVRNRVINEVLRRYVEEDFGWMLRRTKENVPRFLLNDIARYWRTMAVDFANKRRARQAKGWALRTLKLRFSRKLIYAAGLLTCYSCRMIASNESQEKERTFKIVDHLADEFNKPPLEVLAESLLPFKGSPIIGGAVSKLFSSYNAFLGILDNAEQRAELDALAPGDAHNNTIYERGRSLGHKFQEGLDAVFLTENGTPYFDLTKHYGVF